MREAASILAAFPRRRLGFFPTPLVEMERLGKLLGGPRIFIKRDDQTGLAMGGNKTRKLEYFLGEALAQGCDSLVTAGAAQSNHCRQTAAAAAANGLTCHLLLGGEAPDLAGGNLLLDELLGATIHWCGSHRKGEDIPKIAEGLRAGGHRPFVIPYGGSTALGALGFVEAARELRSQLEEFRLRPSAIVFASSSGGTQAGLEVGTRLFGIDARLVAIGIDKYERRPEDGAEAGLGGLPGRVRSIARETAALLGLKLDIGEPGLREDFLGEGYGVVGDNERRAILLAARTEGILLDPVYAGRAFGALISMIEAGEFSAGEELIFWHTGGSPALFSYASALLC
jgi:D-cysteine desulfhydrase